MEITSMTVCHTAPYVKRQPAHAPTVIHVTLPSDSHNRDVHHTASEARHPGRAMESSLSLESGGSLSSTAGSALVILGPATGVIGITPDSDANHRDQV
jgi:hypothetical protein